MRKLSLILTVLILASLLVPAVFAQDPAQDVVGNDPVAQPNPDIAPFAVGEAGAVPAAPNPEDVLWDQYANFSGTSLAAQDFESAYDAYDVWTGDDFQNLEAWTIDTIVSRAAWTGFVDLNNATAIHWYICADSGGAPSCVPGDGSEFWTAHLAPSDPQVSLGVYEPEDFVLTLDTPIALPAGTWWIIFQVSLEYTYYGQVGISTTADAAWGTPAMQINPNGGFGMGSDWWINDYNYDAMFRLEGTTGGMQEPDIRVEPESLYAEQCPDTVTEQILQICNDGTDTLDWGLQEVGSNVQDVLWDNGPLVTHPGGGYGGADLSALQTTLGLNTYGFGNQYIYAYRMADDFEVDTEWTVDQITFFAYQTNSPTDPSTITGLYFQIWDGLPDDPGSSIVFGDLVTNRLANSTWSGIYRAVDYDPTNSARPIMANTATAGVTLPPGTYWLDWLTDGSLSSGPWAPPISILGETTTGNAMQNTGVWAAALDTGTGTQQGMPFIIEGTAGGEPGIPWLSEDPTSGWVAPGDCTDVTITFDSTGLDPDTYMAQLMIVSNDPDEPEIWVPVTLEVLECGDTIHVEDIDGLFTMDYLGRPILRARVWVADSQGMMMGDVLVDAAIWVPDGGPIYRSRYTKPTGAARFHWGSVTYGTWTVCVENLTLAGYTYNPDDNVVTCQDWYY